LSWTGPISWTADLELLRTLARKTWAANQRDGESWTPVGRTVSSSTSMDSGRGDGTGPR